MVIDLYRAKTDVPSDELFTWAVDATVKLYSMLNVAISKDHMLLHPLPSLGSSSIISNNNNATEAGPSRKRGTTLPSNSSSNRIIKPTDAEVLGFEDLTEESPESVTEDEVHLESKVYISLISCCLICL